MEGHRTPHLTTAVEDFRQARRQATMQELTARLTGRTTYLLPFDEVCQKLKVAESTTNQRLEQISLAAIVGSVGRYTDFTRTFLPRQDSDESRWVAVKEAMSRSGKKLPPIEVYQVGQVYFVQDGNHRVSVSRQMGLTHIEARILECQTAVPLSPDDTLDDLIVKVEYADFLEQTRLSEIRPEADLRVTVPGQYWELLTYLEAHHFLLNQERRNEVSDEESISDWYDNVYWPVIQDIQERGLLWDFPDRTETDLYLWIFKHRHLLEKRLGLPIKLEAAVNDWVTENKQKPQSVVARAGEKLRHALIPVELEAGPGTGFWRRERLSKRREEQLFVDILVPLGGDEGGWQALDFALEVAERERGRLFGLHVVSSMAQKQSEAAQSIKMIFQQRCQMAGVPGELSIEVGDIVGIICEWTRWADLVVMYPADPPGTRLMSRFSSGSRNVIHRSCRPVLTVPSSASSPERVLLAFDNSGKAQEGLFVAAYLATQWQVSLTVLTVLEQPHYADMQDMAQAYLAEQGVIATFKTTTGQVAEAILNTAAEESSDLIIMGGYGVKPLREVVLGSKVDPVIRESRWPILICR